MVMVLSKTQLHIITWKGMFTLSKALTNVISCQGTHTGTRVNPRHLDTPGSVHESITIIW
jgi:hypothetical protein